MFLRSKTLFSAMLMAVSSIVHADSLCGDSQCDVTFMFDGGGSITASEGVTFKLTVGGDCNLEKRGLLRWVMTAQWWG